MLYTHSKRHLVFKHQGHSRIFTTHNHLSKRIVFKKEKAKPKTYEQICSLLTHPPTGSTSADHQAVPLIVPVPRPFLHILETAPAIICERSQRSGKNTLILCRKDCWEDWTNIRKMLLSLMGPLCQTHLSLLEKTRNRTTSENRRNRRREQTKHLQHLNHSSISSPKTLH